jgi:hypothetical protein
VKAYETMGKAELVKMANGGDFGAQNELLRRELSPTY